VVGRPTLSLSFKDIYGGLDTETKPIKTRVPTFFANLLPEGHLRKYLAQRAGVNQQRDFFLLWVLGCDLPGAIRMAPADAESWPEDAVTDVNESGVAEFVRRFTFNALIGNGDMHLKNWSVFYADKRHAAIAPAYDFVSTILYIKNDTLGLNFAGTKSFADLDLERFDRFAGRAKLSSTLVRETVKDTVARFHAPWAGRKDLPISADLESAITAHLEKVPIAKEGV